MNVAEFIAKRFHEEYERIAPKVEWATQEAAQVPWEELPKPNRDLMILVVQSLMAEDTICDGPRATDQARGRLSPDA